MRIVLAAILAGAVLVGGVWMLVSVLTYFLIPILGVIGAVLGLG